jgi:hypothetical protein
MNNLCPICGQPTQGKQVRDVNFCEIHRKLAIVVRDDPELAAKVKLLKGNPLKGEDFVLLVKAFIAKSNQHLEGQGKRIIGSDIREKISNILDKTAAGTLLRVTFKPEGAVELMYLVGMLRAGFITTTREWDDIGIFCVAESKRWEHVERTFVFRIVRWGESEREWFEKRLERAIEDIDIQHA